MKKSQRKGRLQWGGLVRVKRQTTKRGHPLGGPPRTVDADRLDHRTVLGPGISGGGKSMPAALFCQAIMHDAPSEIALVGTIHPMAEALDHVVEIVAGGNV